jgi:tRNA dimethylallyltransferase
MQIYQGMDIGTAKPTRQERKEVRHHLLDWVRPDETFSVARFVALATQIIAEARANKTPLIAVGGTPLYFKSLFYGLFEGPSADAALRHELGELTGEQLHAELSQVDPPAAARIHIEDRKRLIRALEVFKLTGKPISSFQTDWESAQAAKFPAIWIGLRRETAAINRRINARVKEMISAGWLDEVRRLAAADYPWSQTAAGATGYQYLLDHLNGKLTLDDAVEQIKIATRQLARRQMKWFKRFPEVHWLEGNRSLQDNVDEVLRFWGQK